MERRSSVLAKHNYELMFVIDPGLDETELESLLQRIQGYLTDSQAEVASFKSWGLRRLAYTIRGRHEGRYYLAEFAMDPQQVATFERNLRLAEGVLRNLITVVEEHAQKEPKKAPQGRGRRPSMPDTFEDSPDDEEENDTELE